MAAPRAILFDLGGVLLPFDRERRVRVIAERTGKPANIEAARARGWDAILFTANGALMADLAARGLP